MHSSTDGAVLDDVCAVVVHHRSLESLGTTVRSLIGAGICAEAILVVDNGGTPVEVLRSLTGPYVNLERTPNHGYAGAVNRGVEYFRSDIKRNYFLVCTHETNLDPNCVRELRAHLDSHPRTAVCGPLLTTNEGATIWSAGGYLTKTLRLPRHRDHYAPMGEDPRPAQARRVEWLDGALMLYRKRAIEATPLPENYFLYMEEVDHHLSLRQSGADVVCVGSARADQSSNGIPDFYLGRNMQLLQNRHGSRVSRALAVPYELIRRTASDARHLRQPSSASGIRRGWLNALIGTDIHPTTDVLVVNPLASALAHYAHEMDETLTRAGVRAHHIEIAEPSRADYGRASWLARFYIAILRARLIGSQTVIACWPPLGLLDIIVMAALSGRRSAVVVHDPEPMVRAVGYGRVAGALAKRVRTTTVISHSETARIALLRRGIHSRKIAHPMSVADASERRAGATQIILVFGQYKPDRDLTLMESIENKLGTEYRLMVRGRGWPCVPGWDVVDSFVPEDSVDDLLRSAAVVLIPYRRFFQSGVAVRCLELGVPFVGPHASSLGDLVGSESPLLPGTDDDWPASIDYAVRLSSADVITLARSHEARSALEWKQAVDDL